MISDRGVALKRCLLAVCDGRRPICENAERRADVLKNRNPGSTKN